MTTQCLDFPGPPPLGEVQAWIEQADPHVSLVEGQVVTGWYQGLRQIAALVEGFSVKLLQAAESSGQIAASTSVGVAGWVKDQSAAAGAPVTGSQAARVQRITQACKAPGMGPLADAVTTGALGVEAGAVAAGELSRIRAHVPAEAWDACVGKVVDRARQGASAREMAQLRDSIIAQYSEDEDYLGRRERAAYRQRELTRFQAHQDGSFTARLRLDGPSTAVVEAAIEALAAPNPDRTPHPMDDDPEEGSGGSGAGGRDRRTAGQRRADALLDMCRAYIAHPEVAVGQRPGAVAKAQVVITMNLEDLRRQTAAYGGNEQKPADGHASNGRAASRQDGTRDGTNGQGATGHGDNGHNHAPAGPDAPSRSANGNGSNGRSPLWRTLTKSGRLVRAQGCGLTSFGVPLSAEVVRAFACEAHVIPMVLGSRSEILDQGRAVRTATPGQLAHLRERDKGCTFPHCDRPPGFCQAHHIRHWIDGGPTDIGNLALLCTRHHQVVHRDHYLATVTATGVTWHPPSQSALANSTLTKGPSGVVV